MKTIFLLILVVVAAAAPATAQPAAAYHLELEARPAAPFPYLSKFGNVEIHIYGGGARAEFLWLNAFSRNGAADVTVTNPLGRMYVEVAIREIASIVKGMTGPTVRIEQISVPVAVHASIGKVKGVAATRHRLVYGPEAHIDYWTTNAVRDNPQARAIVQELLLGLSPETAKVTKSIRGVPLYVELNFRRFKKVPLVTMKKLTMGAGDEKSALERGPLYIRAGVLEKLWEK